MNQKTVFDAPMRFMGWLWVCLMLCFFASWTHAETDKWTLRIAPHAIHLSDKGDPNEQVHLFGIDYNRWAFATFLNSYDDRTYAVGYHVLHKQWFLNDHWHVNARVPVGIMHGYGDRRDNWNGWAPFVVLNLGLGVQLNSRFKVGANLSYLPTSDGGVVIPELQIGYPF